ncbi:NADPH--cytochrome P450 reductase [Oopsacas minuta]|uniref:NADPH--cytochrome P450 reductase n=1 Tax=Oopsacas minuta TaxID=111878 RepID=A0AAV7J8G1_9METZ|nr:NADPH--cytochrome P450 reductase [Oopsacas minuta]
MATKEYPPVQILYGSQKGQAQAIAEEVLETGRQEFSLQVDIACLSQPGSFERLKIGGFVVFIVSTTGEGEPPDTVRKFWRLIKNRGLSNNLLSNLRFALLGLGDSNYANFCAMGKNLNQRLLSLGAIPFFAPGFADDGTGLEVVVDPWVDNLWQSFQTFITGNKQEFSDNEPLLDGIIISSKTSPLIVSKQPTNLIGMSEKLESAINQIQLSAIDINNKNGKKRDHVSDSPLLMDSQIPLLRTSISASPVSSNNTSANMDTTNTHYVSTVNTQQYGQLSTPMLQHEYLHLEITDNTAECPSFRAHPIYPHDIISICQLVKANQLTDTVNYPDVNTVIELDIQMHDPFGFQAGDAVGILCPNDEFEVEYLLQRLHLKDKANSLIELSIIPHNKKNGACIPPYIPNICSVKELFLHHLDIRAIPKKVFISSY